MTRALRRRLDRLELAREPGLATGDHLAEVLEEFAATADPEACARAVELIDRVAAECGVAEICQENWAVPAAAEPAPERLPDVAPAAEPPAVAPPAAEPAPASGAKVIREPPLQLPDLTDPKQDWELIINKPPPGPRAPPPSPYRDPLEDPMGMYD